MEPTDEAIAALHRDDIEIAKRMTGAEKLRAGAELFDMACRVTMSGIRAQHPGISEDDVLVELKRRIAIGNRLEWNREDRF
jgi:hypothetical protein